MELHDIIQDILAARPGETDSTRTTNPELFEVSKL